MRSHAPLPHGIVQPVPHSYRCSVCYGTMDLLASDTLCRQHTERLDGWGQGPNGHLAITPQTILPSMACNCPITHVVTCLGLQHTVLSFDFRQHISITRSPAGLHSSNKDMIQAGSPATTIGMMSSSVLHDKYAVRAACILHHNSPNFSPGTDEHPPAHYLFIPCMGWNRAAPALCKLCKLC